MCEALGLVSCSAKKEREEGSKEGGGEGGGDMGKEGREKSTDHPRGIAGSLNANFFRPQHPGSPELWSSKEALSLQLSQIFLDIS